MSRSTRSSKPKISLKSDQYQIRIHSMIVTKKKLQKGIRAKKIKPLTNGQNTSIVRFGLLESRY
jgi:hypothetical protein